MSRRNCSIAAITAAASSGEALEPCSSRRGRRFTREVSHPPLVARRAVAAAPGRFAPPASRWRCAAPQAARQVGSVASPGAGRLDVPARSRTRHRAPRATSVSVPSSRRGRSRAACAPQRRGGRRRLARRTLASPPRSGSASRSVSASPGGPVSAARPCRASRGRLVAARDREVEEAPVGGPAVRSGRGPPSGSQRRLGCRSSARAGAAEHGLAAARLRHSASARELGVGGGAARRCRARARRSRRPVSAAADSRLLRSSGAADPPHGLPPSESSRRDCGRLGRARARSGRRARVVDSFSCV